MRQNIINRTNLDSWKADSLVLPNIDKNLKQGEHWKYTVNQTFRISFPCSIEFGHCWQPPWRNFPSCFVHACFDSWNCSPIKVFHSFCPVHAHDLGQILCLHQNFAKRGHAPNQATVWGLGPMRSDRRVSRADPLSSLWEHKGKNCYASGFSWRFCLYLETECKSGLVRVGGSTGQSGRSTGQSGGSTGQRGGALVRVWEHWSGWGRTRLSPFCSVRTYVVSTRAIGPLMSISYTVDNNTLRLRVLSPEPDVMSLSIMRVT